MGLRSLEPNDGWTLKKSVDSVDIYTKGVTTMKTYGHGIRHLVSHMLMAEDRPKYDEICAAGKTVESYLPYYRIVYLQLKSPAAIITPRDVLTLSRILFEDDGSLLVATQSTEHATVPEDPSFVRVTTSAGYI